MFRPFLAFLVAVLVLTVGHADTPNSVSLREFVQNNRSRHAVGLYLQGKRVGYMIVELTLGKHEGQDVAIENSEMRLVLSVMDEKSTVEQRDRVVYSLAGQGKILFAERRAIHDERETVYTATPTERGMRVKTKVGDNISAREIPQPKASIGLAQRISNWLKSGPRTGESFEYWTAEWEEEVVDSKETFTYQGKKSIVWGGVPTDVYQVTVDMKGAIFNAEVLANGNPVRGKVGGLLELRAEREEVARKLDKGGVDMIAASSIKVDRDLGDSKYITALTLEATGLGNFVPPVSHRQKLVRDGDRTLLELKADFRTKDGESLSDADRKSFTTPTPTLQSNEKKVIKLAEEIVGDEHEVLKKVDRIKSWVYRKLRKSMASNSLTTMGVLDSMAGDCTEHSLLFVSLCRAAGIPAREVTGVAHIDAIFGWHAWAEIHDGHQWVSVDPTWNQLYVDATHIVFSRDPNDHAWLNVLGNVKFKTVKLARK